MQVQPDEIRFAIQRALEQVDTDLAVQIRLILFANLDRGRIQNFLEDDLSRLPEYIQRVISYHEKLHTVLHELQIEKAKEPWDKLIPQMRVWAYHFLVRKGYPAIAATGEQAEECANEAASRIFGAYFPYDTDLEPWLHMIVNHVCLKFIEKDIKGARAEVERFETLENSLLDLNDPLQPTEQSRRDLAILINTALEQLSPLRRRIIQLKYFDGLTAVEIAKLVGKSVKAVYSLQFNALQDLRKILTPNRDNLNE